MGLLNKFLAEGFITEISGNRKSLASGSLDQLNNFLSVLFLAGQIVNDHVRPFSREGNSSGPPDTRIPARDKCLPIRKSATPAIGFFTMVRPRLHLVRFAGHALRLMFEFWQRVLLRRVLKRVEIGHG